jgi:ceramide glucosyltransferase
MLALLAWLLAFLVFASAAYCLIVVGAARSYLRNRATVRPAADGALPPMSILKPLAGADEGIEENLRSFFTQDYPDFEILFAVRDESDAAVDIVGQLQKEYPQVPCRLIVTGEPPYPNAKVYSLQRMIAAARHELLAMSDSDVRVTPDFLRVAAAEFRNPKLGMTTCPYRAVPGGSFWSRLEAIGMNTEFLGGVLAARLIEGVKFALGPTIVARRKVLGAIGGIERFRDYLAEDFVLGKFAAEAGFGVELSGYIIEHRIGSQPFAVNMRHRLRWARSTRRSRPSGYAGQIFTHPLPFALGLLACSPILWPLALTALVLRALAAWAVAGWVLHDPLCRRHWYLIPLQDFLSFGFWIAGFFGNYISWRGRRYYLRSDGRFELVDS